MNNGDEGYILSFDDETGCVYLAKPERTRVVHISACAWVEYESKLDEKRPQEVQPGQVFVKLEPKK